ncbi:ABC transporter permease [Dactylosporangium aurantiacum]|uniref:ABC transporter permease n=1 Tax=Dactylosporangium aurantiacum TaxID=35754 RepID=A0A9Q9IJU3_9ACTN|nr:ABC transporter permease [Dactylosporangium aurantiacum]MDG6100706.1 ABC transporter permease [Dactylosporangium aurantiacum]UWZ55222.1 ABC transporter permease [Dactylosporangium aurantiacum]
MSFLARGEAGNPWFSWSYVRDNADTIRDALLDHVAITVWSVAIAVAIAVPLAVLAYWVRPLATPILTSASVLYTIPSLALLAFLAPFLGTGRTPVVVALVLYALIVIIRNALTGLQQVPGDVREAATAMGYGRGARLLRVELPLALPAILTGLRLATVSTVALVTVGAAVGSQGGLGALILSGFRNNFYKAQIATAALICVLLALVLDLLLVALTRALTPWTRRKA